MATNLEEMEAEVRKSSVEKVPDFFNTPMADDTEKTGVCTAPPDEKVGDLFNKREVFAMANGDRPTAAPDTPWEGLVESPLQMTVPAPAPLRSGRPATLTPTMMDQICLLNVGRRQVPRFQFLLQPRRQRETAERYGPPRKKKA